MIEIRKILLEIQMNTVDKYNPETKKHVIINHEYTMYTTLKKAEQKKRKNKGPRAVPCGTYDLSDSQNARKTVLKVYDYLSVMNH